MDYNNVRLLRRAVAKADTKSLSILLETATVADINFCADGTTAVLHHSVRNLDIECTRLLLHAGADPNIRGQGGAPPLHFVVHSDPGEQDNARHKQSIDMACLLCAYGADTKFQDSQGYTPLHIVKTSRMASTLAFDSTMTGSLILMNRLGMNRLGSYEVRSDKDTGEYFEKVPGDVANEVIVKILRAIISQTKPVLYHDIRNSEGQTPFHYWCVNNRVDLVHSALKTPGAVNINTYDVDYESPILSSVVNNRYEVVKLLVGYAHVKGSIISPAGEYNAMHLACANRDLDMVEILSEKYAPLMVMKDDRGRTPLDFARERHGVDYVRQIEQLLESKARDMDPIEQLASGLSGSEANPDYVSASRRTSASPCQSNSDMMQSIMMQSMVITPPDHDSPICTGDTLLDSFIQMVVRHGDTLGIYSITKFVDDKGKPFIGCTVYEPDCFRAGEWPSFVRFTCVEDLTEDLEPRYKFIDDVMVDRARSEMLSRADEIYASHPLIEMVYPVWDTTASTVVLVCVVSTNPLWKPDGYDMLSDVLYVPGYTECLGMGKGDGMPYAYHEERVCPIGAQGSRIRNEGGELGTLGGYYRDPQTSTLVGISCAHTFANMDENVFLDTEPRLPIGRVVYVDPSFDVALLAIGHEKAQPSTYTREGNPFVNNMIKPEKVFKVGANGNTFTTFTTSVALIYKRCSNSSHVEKKDDTIRIVLRSQKDKKVHSYLFIRKDNTSWSQDKIEFVFDVANDAIICGIIPWTSSVFTSPGDSGSFARRADSTKSFVGMLHRSGICSGMKEGFSLYIEPRNICAVVARFMNCTNPTIL